MFESVHDIILLITKVVLLIYIVCVPFFDASHMAWIDVVPVRVAMITAVLAFLWFDVTIAILLAVCFLLTVLKGQSYEMEREKKEQPRELPTALPTQPKLPQKHTDPEVGKYMAAKSQQVDMAQKAIDKYAIDTYLEKAATDGIIPQNRDKYLNPLGIQMNIQGIEDDIVGFNYVD